MQTEIDTWERRAGVGGGGQPKNGFVTGVEGRTKKRDGRVSKLVKHWNRGNFMGLSVIFYLGST